MGLCYRRMAVDGVDTATRMTIDADFSKRRNSAREPAPEVDPLKELERLTKRPPEGGR